MSFAGTDSGPRAQAPKPLLMGSRSTNLLLTMTRVALAVGVLFIVAVPALIR
jgi:hypothetical protein